MAAGWVAKKVGRWVAKLARLLDTAALWVRIQTSLKNTKWAKELPTHSILPKNILKIRLEKYTTFIKTVYVWIYFQTYSVIIFPMQVIPPKVRVPRMAYTWNK